jgi:UDP-glucose 4-epimerase
MKILVTGAAGFLASTIVDSLIDKHGADVVALDNLRWGCREDVHPKAKFKNLDILNEDKIVPLMEGVDAVIHCAASLEVTLSQNDPFKDLKTNLMGTISVLNSMRRADVKRLINFSSGCVYGPGHYGMFPVHEHMVDTSSPHWGYGSSKLSAEIYCNQYAKTYNMRVIHIRPGIVCGPREWYGRVLTIFLKRALEMQPLVIFGSGLEERDFVHVYDVRDLTLKALANIDRYHIETFNGGTGRATRIGDLAAYIGKNFGVPVEHEEVPEGGYSEKVEGRIRLPFEMKSMRLSGQKARTELGSIPRRNLITMIKDEVSWLQKDDHLSRWSQGMKV